jgi:ABC-type lipoprotein export system ATPase subunit
VAIARALVNRPKVLLADEPTGNLDSHAGAEIMGELQRLNRECGQTILVVTHDPAIAAFTARVITLRDGRIASDEHREDRAGARIPEQSQPGGPWTPAQQLSAGGMEARII